MRRRRSRSGRPQSTRRSGRRSECGAGRGTRLLEHLSPTALPFSGTTSCSRSTTSFALPPPTRLALPAHTHTHTFPVSTLARPTPPGPPLVVRRQPLFPQQPSSESLPFPATLSLEAMSFKPELRRRSSGTSTTTTTNKLDERRTSGGTRSKIMGALRRVSLIRRGSSENDLPLVSPAPVAKQPSMESIPSSVRPPSIASTRSRQSSLVAPVQKLNSSSPASELPKTRVPFSTQLAGSVLTSSFDRSWAEWNYAYQHVRFSPFSSHSPLPLLLRFTPLFLFSPPLVLTRCSAGPDRL